MAKNLFLFLSFLVLLFFRASIYAQNISGVVNSYAKVSSISGTALTITNISGSIADFGPGDKVLVIQMKGADINRSNTTDYGSIIDLKEAGNYEYAIIDNLTGAGPVYSLTLHHLTRPYDASGFVQIISVPQYDDVTISADISALPWNSASGTGGVLVLEVAGTLTLAANIDVSGKGFAGGAVNPTPNGNGTDVTNYVTTNTILGQKGEGIAAYGVEGWYGMGALANGGGGGNTHNAGGGGGGNFSAGGLGGESHYGPGGNGNPGKQIVANPGDNKLFMGGGGGGGQENNSNASPGGAGGGIIIIRANKLTADCGSARTIIANGANAANTTGNDGGGGGGAGGNIFLEIGTFDLTCDIDIFTNGGNGGNVTTTQKHAGGGGGGAGAIMLPGTSSSPFTIITSNPGNPGLDCSSGTCTSTGSTGTPCAGDACDGDETWPVLPNTAPIAYDDNITIAKDGVATIAVLDNDKDADFKSVFTVSAISGAVNGAVALSGNNFIYTPNAGFTGSDSFQYQICDNGTPALCNTATAYITVNAILLSGIESSPLFFTEGQFPAEITASLTIDHVDNTTLTGAIVEISDNYVPAEDLLIFTNAYGITGSWDAGLGRLTLSGTASLADYEMALQSVTYNNTNSNSPSNLSRTINFTAMDGSLNSNTISRNVQILPVNDAPLLSAVEASLLSFTEGQSSTPISATIALTDVDNTNLASATVTIASNYASGEDVLSFTNANGITGSWNAGTGILTLTGNASLAHYQAALRAVRYRNTNNNNPSAATRTVSFTVSDGGLDSNVLTRDIEITPVNDAPALAAIENTALAVTEGDAAKTVSASITTADVDNTNLSSATIQISANYIATEDVLSFTNANGISGTWNAATGALSLSGSTTVANYQAALRSVTYQNTNGDNPAGATRTISITISDGALNSTTVSRNIEITSVNDAPVLAAIETTALVVTEGDAAKNVSASITTMDVDNTNLSSATIQISTNYITIEDVLAFTDAHGIAGTWDALTGTLSLSGNASLAHYQAALQSITYQNTNGDNPAGATRTVSFTVSDGSLNSNILTRDIEITPVNDAPALAAIEATALAFTEGDAAKNVSASITTADVDNTHLSSAVIQISANHIATEDVLAFTDANGITGSWDAASGTLTLSGGASLVNYQAALRSITYQNTNQDDPSSLTRTVSISINDGNLNSNILTRNIKVTPVNDAPELSTIEITEIHFTEGDPATILTAQLENNDVDNATLAQATIGITTNYLATEDILSFTDFNGISGSWDSSLGTLALTGVASLADYQTALRTITYQNINNEKPSELSRTLSFTVYDGNLNSNTLTREIVIIPVNDAPVSADDAATTDKNVVVSIDVLQNDMDVEGDALQVSPMPVTPPAHGTLVLNADQTFTYTPDFNFFGDDSFVYELCDDGSPVECSTATVNITINYKNYPPVALDDIVDTKEDEVLVVEVLANDSDPDLDAIHVSPELITKPKFGKITLSDNKYTYTPNPNYNGGDSFQYQICDNGTPSICATATVDIYVDPVNDAPEPADDAYRNKDVIAEIHGNVLENDYDIEADFLSVDLTTLVLPQNGELTIHENGDFSYLPNPGFFGQDTFEYFVCDDGEPSLCTRAIVSFLVSSGVPKGFSPNGDNTNDEWIITGLEEFPMNKVVVLNRYGDTVFEINGYDNASRVWRGEANRGLKMGGSNLPDGTYFYVIDFGDGKSIEKGFIIIKR